MNQPAPSSPKLPVSLAANPKLSSWLKFSAQGQITVSPGKVEIGQGIVTALAQIAADELDPTPLYTDCFRLEDLSRAFTRMHARDGNFLKALLAYD